MKTPRPRLSWWHSLHGACAEVLSRQPGEVLGTWGTAGAAAWEWLCWLTSPPALRSRFSPASAGKRERIARPLTAGRVHNDRLSGFFHKMEMM